MSHEKCILIVEDDADLLDNFTEILEGEGYRVLRATNGLVALGILRKLSPNERPHCILLDLMMPRMDGKTFLETLRREHPEDLAKIAVVVASAAGEASTLERIAPVVAMIRKPMDIDDLVSVVARYSGRTRTA